MVGDDYSFGRRDKGCWRRRTGLEKGLIVFFVVLVAAIIVGVLIGWRFYRRNPFISEPGHLTEHEHYNASTKDFLKLEPDAQTIVLLNNETHRWFNESRYLVREESNNHVCKTDGCQSAIEQIRSFYDPYEDACDDFYQFACGGFLKRTVIPKSRVAVNVFTEIVDTLLDQLKMLLADPVRSDEAKPFRMAKEMYQACMDESLIETRGTLPLLTVVDRMGGWPVLVGDSWSGNETWSWTNASIALRGEGLPFNSILTFSVQTNLFNSSIRTLDIDQSSLGLHREYLVLGFDNEHVQNYFNYMVNVSVALGANRTEAKRELQQSVEFEIELAKIGLPAEERRNATALHNPMSIKQLQELYNYIPWVEYIDAMLPDHLNVTDDEIVVNTVPTFFAALQALLQSTPQRTIANYVIWQTVEFGLSYSTKELRDINQEYNRIENGQQEKEPRWQECIDVVNQYLPISVSAIYVREVFNEKSKHTALEMVQNIRQTLSTILDSADWMDEETKSVARNKLQSMIAHVGYPDELDDDAVLEKYFMGLDVDAEQYFESVLSVSAFQSNYTFGQLRELVNKTDWVKHARAATVGGLYRSTENSIQFPAGILQGRFFSADRPAYMNFGAIGFVMGHEMSHGFDDKGRQFDQDGNTFNWWKNETLVHYVEKTDCLIDQYGKYTDPTTQLNVNGLKTLGENIADNGGLKVAYAAYQRWVAANEAEKTLPLFEWTPNQFFWLSAAQSWCTVMTSEQLEQTINTDIHSPERFRVLGTFQNSPEFAADFDCPLGSRMNPVQKCGVW